MGGHLGKFGVRSLFPLLFGALRTKSVITDIHFFVCMQVAHLGEQKP